MTEDVLAEQAEYYRRRAGEYDATAYGNVGVALERIARIVGGMRPRGRVLEIACGTGMWTAALAETADSVTATDASPEVVAIARERVRSAKVRFEVADVFDWAPGVRYDVIFFSAWLSHVPPDRFEQFWRRLGGLLAEGGQVLFIDEHVAEQDKETYVADGIVERRLTDGRTFRVVKNFVDPARLEARLRGLGWDGTVEREGTDWIRGEAHPA